jgi:hypothetical protein
MKGNLLTILFIVLSCVSLLGQQQPTGPANSHSSNTRSAFVPPPSLFGNENMNSLSIKDSNLRPAAPLPGEKAEYPEFTRELLQVQWRDGDPLDLYVIKPHGIPKPPVVLYLYSYPSETDRFRDNEYCKRLVSEGYAAVGFVSAMTGQRYHDRPMREWFVSEMPEAITESVHDVQMVLRYLSDRGDVDLGHAGIFATGSGATIAILAASVEPQIRALDALQPWGDWPTWLAKSTLIPEKERSTYVKPDFLAKVAPLDPVQWFSRVQTKAFRIQFVLDDKVTPALAIQHMKTAIPSSIPVFEYQTARQQYMILRGGRTFDWIKDKLQASNAHTTSARIDNDEHRTQSERTQ